MSSLSLSLRRSYPSSSLLHFMQAPLVLLARMASQVFLVELEQKESLVILEITVGRDKMDPEACRETQVLREVPARRDRRDRQETVDRLDLRAPLVSLEILDFLALLARRDHKVQLAPLVPQANLAQMEPPVSSARSINKLLQKIKVVPVNVDFVHMLGNIIVI